MSPERLQEIRADIAKSQALFSDLLSEVDRLTAEVERLGKVAEQAVAVSNLGLSPTTSAHFRYGHGVISLGGSLEAQPELADYLRAAIPQAPNGGEK